MACNCKKKYDYISEKYSDGIDTEIDNEEEEGNFFTNFFYKLTKIIVQFIFGIIAGCIIIIMIIPMLIYVIFCLMTGLEPHFRLYNIRKKWDNLKEKFSNKEE